MSGPLVALLIRVVVAALRFALAVAIRVCGPIALVKNVDWRRISDTNGLGQLTSLVLTLMSALVAAHGVALYAFAAGSNARGAANVVWSMLLVLVAFALAIGQRRYQDRDAHDGR